MLYGLVFVENITPLLSTRNVGGIPEMITYKEEVLMVEVGKQRALQKFSLEANTSELIRLA